MSTDIRNQGIGSEIAPIAAFGFRGVFATYLLHEYESRHGVAPQLSREDLATFYSALCVLALAEDPLALPRVIETARQAYYDELARPRSGAAGKLRPQRGLPKEWRVLQGAKG